MAVSTRFEPVAALDADARAGMRALLDSHFAGVDADGFATDLAAKTHALRLFVDGALAGFSTIEYRRHAFADGVGGLLYSGDTIVDPAAWAAASLGTAWIGAVRALHAAEGGGRLWWLLLTSGVRTHRYLGACFRRYAPAPEGRCDPAAAALLPELARARFGAAFAAGVVRLSRPQRLRAHLAVVPPHLDRDAHARLFLAANPGWADGDELVSCCRIADDNLTPVGARLVARSAS